MTHEEFKKEFGEQILNDIENLDCLRNELNEIKANKKPAYLSSQEEKNYNEKVRDLQNSIRDLNNDIANLATCYLGIEQYKEALGTAISIALSLDKVKYKNVQELKQWLGNKQGVVSWKMDGITLVVTFDNGKLTAAVIRGNGYVEEDVTANAKYIDGIPQQISYTGHLVVRGEAVMTYEEFERVKDEAGGFYQNPRDLVPDTLRSDEAANRKITFYAFELVDPKPQAAFTDDGSFNLTFHGDRLNWLETLGFNIVEKEYVDSSDILEKIEEWKTDVPNLKFPTDGLIISYNDMMYGMTLGNSGYHFRYSIALKWTDETEKQVALLMNTFSKDGLFVKGLDESQIKDLMEAGLVTSDPLSFYVLANEDRIHGIHPRDDEFSAEVSKLLKKDGWGMKKWDNLMSAIEISRKTTLQKFLYSLNVPLLGNNLSKKLSKYWHDDIDQFVKFINRNHSIKDGWERAREELTAIDGIGEEKAWNVVSWMDEVSVYRERYEDLVTLINELEFPKTEETSADSSLVGLTFVITGSVHEYKNLDEFTASVEARGGKVAGSVSAKTSFLVNNDVNSTSGKNAKAKELNIPIISENEFISRFGK